MKLFFLTKSFRELAGAPFFVQEVSVCTKAPEPGGAGSGYKEGGKGISKAIAAVVATSGFGD